MSWAKFDDQYYDHSKIVEVGPLGMALHTAATCYCARHLTDGFVPTAMIPRLINLDSLFIISNGVSNAVTNKQLTDDLTRVGLFEVVMGGFIVHDYLDYNPPAEQVKRERAENAKRQADWKSAHPNKHVSNGVSNGTVIASRTRTPSRTRIPNPEPAPDSPPPDGEKPKPTKISDPLLKNEAVITYRGISKTTPNEGQRKLIAGMVTDINLWSETINHWNDHGWNKRNVINILEMYSAGGPSSCSMCQKKNGNKSSQYDQTSGYLREAMEKARAKNGTV